MTMTSPRRRFLKGSALATLLSAIPTSWAAVLGYPRALQGPMIGAPGPNHFTVWVRASGAFDVALEYSTDRDFGTVLQGSRAVARTEDDCCVVLRAEGLQPDTPYWYRLRFAGETDRHQPLPHRTRTAVRPLSLGNDLASSVRVAKCWKVTLYGAAQGQ